MTITCRSFTHVRNHPERLTRLTCRLLGPPSIHAFPMALIVLAQFASQSPNLIREKFPTNAAFNKASRLANKRLALCRTAFAQCRAIGVTDEDLLYVGATRATALKRYNGGDIELTFTPRQGQDYRVAVAQLLKAAVKLAKDRQNKV